MGCSQGSVTFLRHHSILLGGWLVCFGPMLERVCHRLNSASSGTVKLVTEEQLSMAWFDTALQKLPSERHKVDVVCSNQMLHCTGAVVRYKVQSRAVCSLWHSFSCRIASSWLAVASVVLLMGISRATCIPLVHHRENETTSGCNMTHCLALSHYAPAVPSKLPFRSVWWLTCQPLTHPD